MENNDLLSSPKSVIGTKKQEEREIRTIFRKKEEKMAGFTDIKKRKKKKNSAKVSLHFGATSIFDYDFNTLTKRQQLKYLNRKEEEIKQKNFEEKKTEVKQKTSEHKQIFEETDIRLKLKKNKPIKTKWRFMEQKNTWNNSNLYNVGEALKIINAELKKHDKIKCNNYEYLEFEFKRFSRNIFLREEILKLNIERISNCCNNIE